MVWFNTSFLYPLWNFELKLTDRSNSYINTFITDCLQTLQSTSMSSTLQCRCQPDSSDNAVYRALLCCNSALCNFSYCWFPSQVLVISFLPFSPLFYVPIFLQMTLSAIQRWLVTPIARFLWAIFPTPPLKKLFARSFFFYLSFIFLIFTLFCCFLVMAFYFKRLLFWAYLLNWGYGFCLFLQAMSRYGRVKNLRLVRHIG